MINYKIYGDFKSLKKIRNLHFRSIIFRSNFIEKLRDLISESVVI